MHWALMALPMVTGDTPQQHLSCTEALSYQEIFKAALCQLVVSARQHQSKRLRARKVASV